jgi:hypothetical protein
MSRPHFWVTISGSPPLKVNTEARDVALIDGVACVLSKYVGYKGQHAHQIMGFNLGVVAASIFSPKALQAVAGSP